MPNGGVEVYDTVSNDWDTINLQYARKELAASAVGDLVFFGGGTYVLRSLFFVVAVIQFEQRRGEDGLVPYVEVLNVTSMQLSIAGNLSVPRRSLAAGAVGSQVVFAGGASSLSYVALILWNVRSSDSYSTVDIFDTATQTWSSTATGAGSLSVGRQFIVALSSPSRILFAGGNPG